jgi:acyl-CoA dehydrogenase
MADTPLSETLERLLDNPSSPQYNTFSDWKAGYYAISNNHQSPWERAIVAGYQANCVGFAFISGYQSALQALVPGLPKGQLSALCITEKDGNHPRAIQSILTADVDSYELTGSKSFVTGGNMADTLLVAAGTNEQQDGHPVLKLVKVDSRLRGVSIEPMPALPFVPEIDHATVHFQGVKCNKDSVLPGDGYTDYVKPFRTIEDIYVSLALCSYLLQVSLSIKSLHTTTESIMACIASHAALAQADPKSRATHLLLAGARQQMEQLLPPLEAQWEALHKESFTCWERDRALLKVASTAREKRNDVAWAYYSR